MDAQVSDAWPPTNPDRNSAGVGAWGCRRAWAAGTSQPSRLCKQELLSSQENDRGTSRAKSDRITQKQSIESSRAHCQHFPTVKLIKRAVYKKEGKVPLESMHKCSIHGSVVSKVKGAKNVLFHVGDMVPLSEVFSVSHPHGLNG